MAHTASWEVNIPSRGEAQAGLQAFCPDKIRGTAPGSNGTNDRTGFCHGADRNSRRLKTVVSLGVYNEKTSHCRESFGRRRKSSNEPLIETSM
jgi:hypothetical protein